ncbi:MAG: IS21 family transposase, partial [Saprospiraceae bacterium]|nr:IS21 family transposase [Saprospiraceae bacterium]
LDPRRSDFDKRLEYFTAELKRVGVTKQILWGEYRKELPQGYGYSQFCYHLSAYLDRFKAVMHLTHRPAEQLMADFAGDKMSWVDLQTGEEHWCDMLILTFPFSSMTYVEALPSQRQEHLLPSLGRGFEYFSGVPFSVKFDNLKPAIAKSNRYEPTITEALQSLAEHYNTTIMAARPVHPRDKASVENAVYKTYLRIYAPLRNHTFHSLSELNAAIRKQVDWHNSLNFQGKGHSRCDIFEQEEKPLLRPLPPTDYTLQRLTWGKVQKNCHVILGQDRHQYSVPFQLIGKQLKIVYTEDTVEVYDKLTRVAVHRRNKHAHGYTTLATHLPANHQHMVARQAWNADYFLEKADKIGSHTR